MDGHILAMQFEYCAYTLAKNLEGITHEDSLVQPHQYGNCINWIVGHVAMHRIPTMEYAGLDPLWTRDASERYGRASAPIVHLAEALPLSELIEHYQSTQQPLLERLRSMSAEELATVPDDKKTRAQEIAALAFHESYHIGQLGVVRRVIGKDGVLT